MTDHQKPDLGLSLVSSCVYAFYRVGSLNSDMAPIWAYHLEVRTESATLHAQSKVLQSEQVHPHDIEISLWSKLLARIRDGGGSSETTPPSPNAAED